MMNYKRVINEYGKNINVLILNRKEYDFYYEALICRKCKCPIWYKKGEEFYFCPPLQKCICKDCELKEGRGIDNALTPEEFYTCPLQKIKDNHKHFLICSVEFPQKMKGGQVKA